MADERARTVAEVAAALGVTPETIERALARGKIGTADLGALLGESPATPPAPADEITAATDDPVVTLVVPSQYKRCYLCDKDKPLTEFHKHARHPDGHHSECKACVKLARADPEYRRAKQEYDRRRYEQFRALRNYQSRAWSAANKDRHRELNEAWQAAHRLAMREIDARRYARMKGQTTGEKVDYEAILARDGYICHICGSGILPHELHFDHVIPLSRGGLHAMANIRPAHAACNMKKGSKLLAEDAAGPPPAPDEVVLQVPMNYSGKYLSVNHCYRKGKDGRVYLRREAFTWRRNLQVALAWVLMEQGISEALAGPVTIRIDAAYVDVKHGTDVDNLFKLTWDAAKVALGVDDREFQPEAGTVTYGAAVPSLTITVRCRLAGKTTPSGPKPRRARTQG